MPSLRPGVQVFSQHLYWPLGPRATVNGTVPWLLWELRFLPFQPTARVRPGWPLLLLFFFLPTTLSYADGNFLHELNVGQTSKHFIRKLTEIKESLLLLTKVEVEVEVYSYLQR